MSGVQIPLPRPEQSPCFLILPALRPPGSDQRKATSVDNFVATQIQKPTDSSVDSQQAGEIGLYKRLSFSSIYRLKRWWFSPGIRPRHPVQKTGALRKGSITERDVTFCILADPIAKSCPFGTGRSLMDIVFTMRSPESGRPLRTARRPSSGKIPYLQLVKFQRLRDPQVNCRFNHLFLSEYSD